MRLNANHAAANVSTNKMTAREMQRLSAAKRWAGKTKAQKSAEMSRIRKIGIAKKLAEKPTQ